MKKITVVITSFAAILVILFILAIRDPLGMMFSRLFFLATSISLIGLSLSVGEFWSEKINFYEVESGAKLLKKIAVAFHLFFVCGYISTCLTFSYFNILPEKPYEGGLIITSFAVGVLIQLFILRIKAYVFILNNYYYD